MNDFQAFAAGLRRPDVPDSPESPSQAHEAMNTAMREALLAKRHVGTWKVGTLPESERADR